MNSYINIKDGIDTNNIVINNNIIINFKYLKKNV